MIKRLCLCIILLYKFSYRSVLLPGLGEGAGEASIKGIESSSNKAFFPFILYPFISTGSGTPLHPCGNFSLTTVLLER